MRKCRMRANGRSIFRSAWKDSTQLPPQKDPAALRIHPSSAICSWFQNVYYSKDFLFGMTRRDILESTLVSNASIVVIIFDCGLSADECCITPIVSLAKSNTRMYELYVGLQATTWPNILTPRPNSQGKAG